MEVLAQQALVPEHLVPLNFLEAGLLWRKGLAQEAVFLAGSLAAAGQRRGLVLVSARTLGLAQEPQKRVLEQAR